MWVSEVERMGGADGRAGIVCCALCEVVVAR